MYKNYKIGSDGSPKYSGNIYKVAPERRFTEYTDEWKRRLDGNSPRLRRRNNKRSENTFTIQVKHILYIILFFIFIGVIQYSKFSSPINMIQTSPIRVTLNNAARDFGNEFNKPNEGNQFLHVSLKFENTSYDVMQINTNEFTLLDDNYQKINVLYSFVIIHQQMSKHFKYPYHEY